MDDIDTLLSILENSTRRSILRRLLLEDSYGLELSKILGISQQAINKQLEILEKANMILSMGATPSSLGPPRKIYKPTGFLSVVIDYTPNFIQISKHTFNDDEVKDLSGELSIERLKELNAKMEVLMNQRQQFLSEKNYIVHNMRELINRTVDNRFARQVLLEYLDSLDVEKVALEMDMPVNVVRDLVQSYFGTSLSPD